MFMVRFQTPVGSSLDLTDRSSGRAGKWLMAQPAVERYFGSAGGMGGGDVSSGMIFVTMKQPKDRPEGPGRPALTQAEFMDQTRKKLATRSRTSKPSIMDLSQTGLLLLARRLPHRVHGARSGLGQAHGPRHRAQGQAGEVRRGHRRGHGLPDRHARGAGLSRPGRGLRARRLRRLHRRRPSTPWSAGCATGSFTAAGRRYDVRVRAEPRYRLDSDSIKKFYVRNNRGEMIRLSEVVRIDQKPSLLAITRKDRERAIGIFANVASRASPRPSPSTARSRSPGSSCPTATASCSGSTKTFQESFQSPLVRLRPRHPRRLHGPRRRSSTRSPHPVTVLLALPFSVSGALFALWIGGQSLNVYSMIGVILLVGIAKKNSIMLVDFTNQVRERGVAHREALMEACPIRLRPILMTSIATIVGALPPALAIGPGGRGAAADGDGARRRHGRLDPPHALRRAGRLQRPRRRPDVESAPPEDGNARGAPEPVPVDSTRPLDPQGDSR